MHEAKNYRCWKVTKIGGIAKVDESRLRKSEWGLRNFSNKEKRGRYRGRGIREISTEEKSEIAVKRRNQRSSV